MYLIIRNCILTMLMFFLLQACSENAGNSAHKYDDPKRFNQTKLEAKLPQNSESENQSEWLGYDPPQSSAPMPPVPEKPSPQMPELLPNNPNHTTDNPDAMR